MPFLRKFRSKFKRAKKRLRAPSRRSPVVRPPRVRNIIKNIRRKRPPNIFARASFANRGFSRVVKSKHDLDKGSPDRNTVRDLSFIVSDMKVEKSKPPSFESIGEFFGIEYVGYIIDKERLDPKTGEWKRTDEYKIIGAESSNFKDSRVAYGYQYRYRARSIMKVTTREIEESHENLDYLEDIKKLEKEEIKKNLNLKERSIANINKFLNLGVSRRSSRRRSRPTTFELMRGLRVEASKSRMRISRISVRNDKRKIRNLRRFKNLRVSDDRIMRGVSTGRNLQRRISSSLRRFKKRSVKYVSYYYEGEPNKVWDYVDVRENIPPPPPESIKIIPNSIKEEILITWLKPANSQRDIKFFKLFRRNEVNQKWTIIAKFSESGNIYVDRDVEFDEEYIYALTCVDAHGIESFLSTQIQAELNSDYESEEKERELKWISGSGVQPDEIGVVLRKFLDQDQPVIARKNIIIRTTKDFSEKEKNLLIRVKSLDTLEQKEFKVSLRNLNIRET